MSNVQQLLESANPWQSLQSDASRLARKWEKTGLLEGLKGEVEKNNMTMLLENQAKQLVVEQSQTGGTAGFNPGTGEQWAGVALPLVRKVFGQIAAKEFVSVQPMNLPSGLVFFLDFQYGTDKNPFASGDSMYGDASANFGNTATGGAYGAGRFGYSINEFKKAGVATVTVGTASWADLNFDADYSASAAATNIKYLRVTKASVDAYADDLGIRSFFVSGTAANGIDIATNLNTFNKVAGANYVFFVDDTAGLIGSSENVDVFYSKQPTDAKRGDFEAGNTFATTDDVPGGTDIVIPQINVQMRSEAITAKTRKLKAQWTPEFAQDLNAYHSLDAEAELTSIMSEYISLEIDMEILDMLIDSAAAGNEYWSAVSNEFINNAATGFDQRGAGNGGFYNTQGQWFQTLGTKMQKLSNTIHQRTLRGGANFCVVSPKVATILESIPGFASTSNGDVTAATYAFGVQKMGAINNRYTIYKNPYMKENTILMGFKGSQFLETGAVFAPYIPLIMTPLVYDPDTFVPRKGLLTRYAKKMVRPEFYGKIFVSGLNTL